MSLVETSLNEGVLTYIINRPEALNAINRQVLVEINDLILNQNYDEVRCVIFRGFGNKAFVAGADINEMLNMSKDEAKEFSIFGNSVFDKISKIEVPTIAVINGFALGGGCELAMACDFRICTYKSIFGQPETSLGIIPGFGGTQRLSRLIGVSKAKEMIFSGRRISAIEAKEIGLINLVCEEDALEDAVISFTKPMLQNAPIAIRKAKEAIDGGLSKRIEDGLLFEAEKFANTFTTEDQIEGMSAFLEKRKHKQYKNR